MTSIENDDDSHIIFSNLEEYDPQEAYILCRAADDPTGHKARQAFREEAASKRGNDNIYFYFKDLIKRHGTSEKKQEEKHFTATSFRAFITTSPSLDASLSDDEKTALFFKIDHGRKGTIHLDDLVHFSLLDKYQIHALVVKYWIYLRRQRLTDAELRDNFNRMLKAEGSDADSICLDLLHATLTREFDVTLTSGELQIFSSMIDLDGDGSIRYQDFTGFYALRYKVIEGLLQIEESPIVDVEVSLSEIDETELRRNGFSQVPINIHSHLSGKPSFIWYKRAIRGTSDVRPAVTKLKLSKSSRDTSLVSSGFTCLMKDINRSGALGRALYIWMSHSTSLQESLQDGIIDITLTTGSEKEENSASLFMPPCRGFIRIDGDLNERNSKCCTYLWVRTRNELIETSLITTPRPNLTVAKTPQRASSTIPRSVMSPTPVHELVLSPSAAKNVEAKFSSVEQLESQVRAILRRKCPVDRSRCLDFPRFFNEFDTKKYGYLSKTVLKQALASLGLKMQNKDFDILWKHIDTDKKGKLRMESFVHFLRLTDAGIDEVSQHIQRALSDAMKQGVDYSERFREFNANGDGKLSRNDFQRLLASVQIRVAPEELSRLIDRFDLNEDGVVDYVDFLRFITGVCDDATREAKRVADAAEEFHTWCVDVQNKKVAKEGNIDSSAAWKLLKSKDGAIPHAHVDKILRARQIRVTPRELGKLAVVIAPQTNGRIDQKSLHRFINHKPKKISQLMTNLKQLYTAIGNSDEDALQALDVEHDGTLDLTTLQGVLKDLAIDVGLEKIDIKDLVYVVQHTGSDIGIDGAIVLDRLVHGICGNSDRRNMKYDFVTTSDSNGLAEGVAALRTEIHRTAKTPDGKYDYRLPFGEFSEGDDGTIVLSEFEKKIKDMDIEKYMTESDIKTLLRRFDIDEKGGIDYTEFRRFASEPIVHPKQSSFATGKQSYQLQGVASGSSDIHRIFQHLYHDIVAIHGRVKRQVETAFARHDSEGTGSLLMHMFQAVLKELIAPNYISKPDESRLIRYLSPRIDDPIDYREFCIHLFQSGVSEVVDPALISKLLRDLHKDIIHVTKSGTFDFRRAFKSFDGSQRGKISREELEDTLLMAGVGMELSKSEFDVIADAFDIDRSGSVDYVEFLGYINDGPGRTLLSLDIPVTVETPRGQIDAVLAQLQFEIQQMAAKAGGQAPNFSKVFSAFDINGDGYINSSEFIRVLKKFGIAKDILERREHSALLDFFDTDKDGRINYNEFCSFAQNADKRIMARLKGESDDMTLWDSVTAAPDAENVSKILSKIAHCAGRYNFQSEFGKQSRKSGAKVKDAIFDVDFKRVLNKFKIERCPHLSKKDIKQLAVYYAVRNNPALVRHIDFSDAIRALNRGHRSETAPAPNNIKSAFVDDSSDTSSNYSDEYSSDSSDNEYIEKLLTRIAISTNSERGLDKLEKKVRKRQGLDMDTEKLISGSKFRDRMRSCYKLQISRAEMENLLDCFKAGRNRYDIKRFEALLLQAIHERHLVSDDRSSETTSDTDQKFLRSLYQNLVDAARRSFNCLKMFQSCDSTGTGRIDIHEFKVIMKLIGCPLSDADIQKLKKTIRRIGRVEYKCSSCEMDYRAFYEVMVSVGKESRPRVSPLRDSQYSERLLRSPASGIISQVSPNTHERLLQKPTKIATLPGSDYLLNYIRAHVSPQCMQRYGDHDYTTLFKCHDSRGCGFITAAAFFQILTNEMGLGITHDAFSKLLSRFCTQKSFTRTENLVDYKSFCAWLRIRDDRGLNQPDALNEMEKTVMVKIKNRFQELSRDGTQIWETYAMFDIHRSGEISLPEFRESSRQLGLPITAEEMNIATQPYIGKRGIVYKAFLTDAGIRESSVPTTIASPPKQYHSPASWVQKSQNYPDIAHDGWKCSVCYHHQENAKSQDCEICGSPNPDQKETHAKAITQCCVCAFRNAASVNSCTMCGTSLRAKDTHKLHNPVPTLAARGTSTGWMT